jgi:predicted dehydrogenase
VTTPRPGGPSRFAIVGSGWRSEFFLRTARLMPERFQVVGVVTRTGERGSQVEREWGVATFRSVKELLGAESPEFVIVSVPWEAAPSTTVELVSHGVPVLTETPPAPDEQGLRELWSAVGSSGLVQVAEQYLLMPSHAARWSVLRRGTIGSVTSVQVSSTHQYHAVSMIRRLLGAGFSPVEVTARAFTAPLVDPLSREGWAESSEPSPATTTLALLDFGSGRSGVYDFTDNQWFNPLRSNRIVVRGSHGELVDDRVTRILEPGTVVESALVRRQTGIDLNLEGFDLDHISHDGAVVYRNPYQGCRLAEDDISVAAIMDQMAAWRRGEADEPYSLADGCQDHLVALAIEEAVRTGATVTTPEAPWSA